MNPSTEVKAKAPLILAEIKKAKSILLHCHPSPDPDSVASALAMKFALEQMGKKATVIKGDSVFPEGFKHFPGANDIVMKNFFEIDLTQFDLFIVHDSRVSRVSEINPVVIPSSLRTINIDHHVSNRGEGDISLVDASYPAIAELFYDLFILWNIEITHDIAINLFMGIFTDTSFKYFGTTARTFETAAKLVTVAPDFVDCVRIMEQSDPPEILAYQALALGSIRTFLDGKLALAIVSSQSLKEKHIPVTIAAPSFISPFMRKVKDWKVEGVLVEVEPDLIRTSFRSSDPNNFDVSKLVVLFGGGGHKAAAGATLKMGLNEAVDLVVAKAKEIYNL